MTVSERTGEFAGAVDPTAAIEAISADRENTDPTLSTERVAGPAELSWAVGHVRAQRNRLVALKIMQRGGDGTTNQVFIQANGGTAVLGEDYNAFSQYVTMPAGQRETTLHFLTRNVPIPRSGPVTVNITMSLVTGNGRVYPQERVIVEIAPEQDSD
jgi:hypothetical protein